MQHAPHQLPLLGPHLMPQQDLEAPDSCPQPQQKALILKTSVTFVVAANTSVYAARKVYHAALATMERRRLLDQLEYADRCVLYLQPVVSKLCDYAGP